MWANIKLALSTFQIVVSILSQLREWYDNYQLKKIEKHYKAKQTAVNLLTARIAKITKQGSGGKSDDEAIKDLHRRLVNIGAK